MALLLGLFTVGGILLSVLALPMILGRIKPNGLYGFRLRRTMENPEIWYPVNRYSGFCLLGCGLATFAAAIGLIFLPDIGLDAYALGVAAVMAISFTFGMKLSIRYMKSL